MKTGTTGTFTSAVLEALRARSGRWLTMREIADACLADRGVEVKISTIAASLANLEVDGILVDRSKRPFRYRAPV